MRRLQSDGKLSLPRSSRMLSLALIVVLLATYLVAWPQAALADLPSIDWFHQWGGAATDDRVNDVAVSTSRAYFVGTEGGNIFLKAVNIDATGSVEWTVTSSGAGADQGRGVAVDSSDDYVYVTGSFRNALTFSGCPTVNATNYADVFVAQFDTFDGDCEWVRTMGGADDDTGRDIAIDSDEGIVYVTGDAIGSQPFEDFDGSTVANFAFPGTQNVFLAALDDAGSFAMNWDRTKMMGSSGGAIGYGVAGDGEHVYLAGSFVGTNADFDTSPLVRPGFSSGGSGTSEDAFVAKFAPSGAYVDAWKLGGGGSGDADVAYSIALDNDYIYTTGFYQSNNANFAGITLPSIGTGGSDIFVSKLPKDSDGTDGMAWGMGGNGANAAFGISVDNQYIYTAGYFQGTVDFNPGAGTFNLTSSGGEDVFVASLNKADGSFPTNGAKKFGGTLNDQGRTIFARGLDDIYLGGSFRGTADFEGPETSAGGEDGYGLRMGKTVIAVFAGDNAEEDTEDGYFTVAMVGAPSTNAQVINFSISGTAEDNGVDYDLDFGANVTDWSYNPATNTGSFKVTSGEYTAEIWVEVVADNDEETPDETVIFTIDSITDPTSVFTLSSSNKSAEILIIDDDAKGFETPAVPTTPIQEEDPDPAPTLEYTYNLVLKSNPSGTAVIRVTSDNGQLQFKQGANWVSSIDLSFASVIGPLSVTYRATPDNDHEDNPHTSTISHTAVFGYDGAEPLYLPIEIIDNDPISLTMELGDNPGVPVDLDTSCNISETEVFSYLLKLNTKPDAATQIQVFTDAPSEVELSTTGADPWASSVTVEFQPDEWDEGKYIYVRGINDGVVEGGFDTIHVKHNGVGLPGSEYNGVSFVPDFDITCKINDINEKDVFFTRSPALTDTLHIYENPAHPQHTANLSATLGSKPTANTNITIGSQNTTDLRFSKTGTGDCSTWSSTVVLNFTTTTWKTEQPLYVCALQDGMIEADPEYDYITAAGSGTGSDYNGFSNTTAVSVTIHEGDTPGFNVTNLSPITGSYPWLVYEDPLSEDTPVLQYKLSLTTDPGGAGTDVVIGGWNSGTPTAGEADETDFEFADDLAGPWSQYLTVHFSAGPSGSWKTGQFIYVRGYDDEQYEGDTPLDFPVNESGIISHTAVGGTYDGETTTQKGAGGADGDFEVYIQDNDPLGPKFWLPPDWSPIVDIDDSGVWVDEGDVGLTKRITVTLASDPGDTNEVDLTLTSAEGHVEFRCPASVPVAECDDPGVWKGPDLGDTDLVLTLGNNATVDNWSKTLGGIPLDIRAVDDGDAEGTPHDGVLAFEIGASTAPYNEVNGDTVNLTVNITDDDQISVSLFEMSPISDTLEDGDVLYLHEALGHMYNTVYYTMTLDSMPGGSVTIEITSTNQQLQFSTTGNDGTWASNLPYVFDAGNWYDPQDVYVRPVPDGKKEANPHPSEIVHRLASGDGSVYTPANFEELRLTVNITDDDEVGMETWEVHPGLVSPPGIMTNNTTQVFYYSGDTGKDFTETNEPGMSSETLVYTMCLTSQPFDSDGQPTNVTIQVTSYGGQIEFSETGNVGSFEDSLLFSFGPGNWDACPTIYARGKLDGVTTISSGPFPTTDDVDDYIVHSVVVDDTGDPEYQNMAAQYIEMFILNGDEPGVNVEATDPISLSESLQDGIELQAQLGTAEGPAKVVVWSENHQVEISLDGMTWSFTQTLEFSADWESKVPFYIRALDDQIYEGGPGVYTYYADELRFRGHDDNASDDYKGDDFFTNDDLNISIEDNDEAGIKLLYGPGHPAEGEGVVDPLGFTEIYSDPIAVQCFYVASTIEVTQDMDIVLWSPNGQMQFSKEADAPDSQWKRYPFPADTYVITMTEDNWGYNQGLPQMPQVVCLRAWDDSAEEPSPHSDLIRWKSKNVSTPSIFEGLNGTAAEVEIEDNDSEDVRFRDKDNNLLPGNVLGDYFYEEGQEPAECYKLSLTNPPTPGSGQTVEINVDGGEQVRLSTDGDGTPEDNPESTWVKSLDFIFGEANEWQWVCVRAVDDDLKEDTIHDGIIQHSVVSGTNTTYTDYVDKLDPGQQYTLLPGHVTVHIVDNDAISILVNEVDPVSRAIDSTSVVKEEWADPDAFDFFTIRPRTVSGDPVKIVITPTEQLQLNREGFPSPGAGQPIELNFPAGLGGVISRTIEIRANDDFDVEGPHEGYLYFSVYSNGVYDGIEDFFFNDTITRTGILTVSIVDNDTTAVLIDLPDGVSNEIDEAGTTIYSYTVRLQGQPTSRVNVGLDFFDGSQIQMSTDGLNWNTTGHIDIAFTTSHDVPGGWNMPRSLYVRAIQDDIAEGDLPYLIVHTATSDDPQYNHGDGVVYIVEGVTTDPGVTGDVPVVVVDDDLAGVTITPQLLTLMEDRSGIYEGSYTVVLNDPLPAGSVVQIDITPATGSEGQVLVDDGSGTFTNTGVLIFDDANPWNVAQTVRVQVVDDDIPEGSPHLATLEHTITSDSPLYDALDLDSVEISITDNDTAGMIIVDPDTGLPLTDAELKALLKTDEDGTPIEVWVRLTKQPTADVGVSITSADCGEGVINGSCDPTTLTFTTGNWNVPQMFVITGVPDDDETEGPYTFFDVNLVSSSLDEDFEGLTRTLIVENADTTSGAGFTVFPLSITTDEDDPLNDPNVGSVATFTMTIQKAPTADVEVRVADYNQSAGTISPTVVIFSAGMTETKLFEVTGTDDGFTPNDDIVYTITFSDAMSSDINYGGRRVPSVEVTHKNNDFVADGTNLSIQVEVEPGVYGPGDPLTYTITYKNKGPDDATGVVITATIDPNLVSFDPDKNPGWTCDMATGICTYEVGDVPAGADAQTISLVVDIRDDVKSGTMTTRFGITDDSGTENDPDDNYPTVDIIIQGTDQPDLWVQITGKTGIPLTFGEVMTVSLAYGNRSTATADGEMVYIQVRSDADLSLSQTDETTGSLQAPAWNCQQDGSEWVCRLDVGDLPVGEEGETSFQILVPEGQENAFVRATIREDKALTSDLNFEDNTDRWDLTAGPWQSHTFLPALFKQEDTGPVVETDSDLQITNVWFSPTNPTADQSVDIFVEVSNLGTGPTTRGFWVDLYIDPSTVPTVNQRWSDIEICDPADQRDCLGIAWRVEGIIQAGGKEILISRAKSTYGGPEIGYPDQDVDDQGNPILRAEWPGSFPAGTNNLYVQVDSWGGPEGTANREFGAMIELNDDNNVSHTSIGPLSQ
ncbi:MAG: DUF11 domain-containing protein [Chloroflexaceae bacterium]|nr:DUF11 domain-containing protein [Chloroflexaceae bacterium]